MGRIAIIVCCLIALFVSQPALAGNTAASEIQAQYDALGRSLDAKDWEAMRAIQAPGYRSIDVDGKIISGDEELAQAQALPPMDHKVSKTTVVSVRIEGDTAFVEQRVDIRFRQTDEAGKPHAVEVHALSSDVWKRIAGKWLILRTRTNQIDMAMDGVGFLHKAQGAA